MVKYRRLPIPQSNEGIKALARKVADGQVVLLEHVPPAIAGVVFLPLIDRRLLAGYTRQQLGRIAVFGITGEHLTAGRSVNGYPCFVECAIWRWADVVKAYVLAKRLLEAQEAVLSEA